MRLLVRVAVVCLLGGPALATEAYESKQTLVGWSEDGSRYAVIAEDSSDPEAGPTLDVIERGKVIASFKEGDKGVPESRGDKPAVARIDVERWGR